MSCLRKRIGEAMLYCVMPQYLLEPETVVHAWINWTTNAARSPIGFGIIRPGGRAMRDDRVERVARALCKIDGNDPNAKVPTGRMVTTGEPGPEFYLAWTDYEKEARRFLAAIDAAQPV
jgi:hypothetical protein